MDDHLHDVPDPVFELLEYAAARALQPLTVALERDGSYPSISDLLIQLDRARRAMARGGLSGLMLLFRCRVASERLTDLAFEAYLAKLLVEPDARERFLADREGRPYGRACVRSRRTRLRGLTGKVLAMAARSLLISGGSGLAGIDSDVRC